MVSFKDIGHLHKIYLASSFQQFYLAAVTSTLYNVLLSGEWWGNSTEFDVYTNASNLTRDETGVQKSVNR